MVHNRRTNYLERNIYPYTQSGLHQPLPRYPPQSHRRLSNLQSFSNNRHVRRRKKNNRRVLGRGGEVYHQLEDWRGLYNDLILSETRGGRPRPPRRPLYYNRYRGEYYYWDLDPYSVLGELITWLMFKTFYLTIFFLFQDFCLSVCSCSLWYSGSLQIMEVADH